MDQDLTKRAYTLIGLAISLCTIVSLGSVSLYKIDQLIVEYSSVQERLSFLESQTVSKSEMDKFQNAEIHKLQERTYELMGR